MAASNANSLVCQLRWLLSAKQTSDLSDSQLVERYLKELDDVAFASLVCRHGQLVMGVCRRVLHHVQDAEDVFQATFFLLARKAGSIRRRDAVGSWLYQTAYRLALKVRVRVQQQRTLEEKAESPAAADPLADASWREVREILDEELARLPEKSRTPLLLCYFEGQTQQEAARQLGWPVRTLEARLKRGRELLRWRLAKRGLPSGSAFAATLLAGDYALASVPSQVTLSACQAAALHAAGDALGGAISGSALTIAKGAMKDMVIAKILKTAVAAMLLASVLGGGFGYVLATYSAGDEHDIHPAARVATVQQEQPKKDDNAQLTYAHSLQNRRAVDLAVLLQKHYLNQDVDYLRIAVDDRNNALVVTAILALLDELKSTIAKLDHRPPEVAVQIVLIRLSKSKENADMSQPGDFDVRQLSGPAERVLGSIDDWQKKGKFTSVERYQLRAPDNKATTLDNPTEMSYTAAAVPTMGAGGKPALTPKVLYKTVGTSFTVTAQTNQGGLISIRLQAKDEIGQKSADVALVGIQGGEVVKATEFNAGFLDSTFVLQSGRAIVARDVEWKTNNGSGRVLLVVTAQIIP